MTLDEYNRALEAIWKVNSRPIEGAHTHMSPELRIAHPGYHHPEKICPTCGSRLAWARDGPGGTVFRYCWRFGTQHGVWDTGASSTGCIILKPYAGSRA